MTPDTLDFLILGLVIGFGTIILYVASLFVRLQSTLKDMATIEQLRDE